MLAILVVAIIGVVILWFCGSFWTTGFFIILGGDVFALLFTFEHIVGLLWHSFYDSWVCMLYSLMHAMLLKPRVYSQTRTIQ